MAMLFSLGRAPTVRTALAGALAILCLIVPAGCAVLAGGAAGAATGYVAGHHAGEHHDHDDDKDK